MYDSGKKNIKSAGTKFRTHMDINGCGWGFMGVVGCRGTSAQQKKTKGGIYGLKGQNLGHMVGEISPDLMFCGFCQKWSSKNECIWESETNGRVREEMGGVMINSNLDQSSSNC